MGSQERPRSSSEALLSKAREVTPGGVHSGARTFHQPIVWDHGKGSKVYDLDGNEFIDYICGWGAIIHGHCDEELNAAVSKALTEQDLYGIGTTELEYEAAKMVKDRVPSADRVLFGLSGSEVVAHAIRLARSVTGRKKIIKFQGHYNGWYDSVAVNHETDKSDLGRLDPYTGGILTDTLEKTIVLPYNDLEAVKIALEEHGDDVAAIILEPIGHNMGCVEPKEGYLEGLRDLTERNGSLLIFDEVITGFRHDLGGAQSLEEVTPDLTTMGKAVANGYPASILCGRSEYMEQFKLHGKSMTDEESGSVMYGGTYNAQAGSVAAIKHCIQLIEERDLYSHTTEMADFVTGGIEDLIEDLRLDAQVKRYRGVWTTYFSDNPIENWADVLGQDEEKFQAYRKKMVEQGILMTPMVRRNYISGSHSIEDMQRTIEAAEVALKSVAD